MKTRSPADKKSDQRKNTTSPGQDSLKKKSVTINDERDSDDSNKHNSSTMSNIRNLFNKVDVLVTEENPVRSYTS